MDVRDYAVAMMDRLEAVDAAIGKPRPFFALIQWHRQGSLPESGQRAWYSGYREAAMLRDNASSLDVADLLGYVVFDGSLEAQHYIASEGLSPVTFGNVKDGDISGGDLVSDGTHQTDENANALFASLVARALAQVALCPGDCDGSGVVEFNDLVAMLFEFGMGTGACDADGNGVVEFNDLVTALFLFGPCP